MNDTKFPNNSFISSLGPLSLALRLRRLADRLTHESTRVYEHLDVPLEPAWYTLLLLIDRHGEQSIGSAAQLLEIRHPSMVKMSKSLEDAKLLTSSSDASDARRRVLRLTQEAKRKLPKFKKIWDAFAQTLAELADNENGSIVQQIEQLEAHLCQRGLDVRVLEDLQQQTHQIKSKNHARPTIRPTQKSDRNAVLDMARELVRSGDTYAYDPNISDNDLWEYWHPKADGSGFVAVLDDVVVGMFIIRPNHPGPGMHIANASYAVRADKRGLGLGRSMGEASLFEARRLGYCGMQFNIVISTNTAAVRLWRSLGFKIVGTIPNGFSLPGGRLVDHHIMFRKIES